MFSLTKKQFHQNQISKELFYNTYPRFDWKFYSQYNDLANHIHNENSAIQHYWYYGKNESRRICKIITTNQKLNKLPIKKIIYNVKQCYVSSGLHSFQERFMKQFQLTPYENEEEPCIFFGMYSDEDLTRISKHNGLKYIIWGGEDANPNYNHCKSTLNEILQLPNVIHIAISKCIYNRLKYFHIHPIFVEFSLVNKELFQPIPKEGLGKKIFIFNGQVPGREHIYGKPIYEQIIRNLSQYQFILSNQLNIPHEQMPEIYKQCFVMLRLTKYDGNANSVQECEAMNIPVIHNQSDYGLKWNNINDIVIHIYNTDSSLGTSKPAT
tara:strand:- start:562 stop:1533 length:972 start_codon:yes stop_codon:yes gene_type:complete